MDGGKCTHRTFEALGARPVGQQGVEGSDELVLPQILKSQRPSIFTR
jgi:hypothetical protein